MGIIGLAVVIVVAIATLVFLRIRKKSSKIKGSVVAISDPHEIKQLKKGFAPTPKRKMTNSELMQLEISQKNPILREPLLEPAILKEKEKEAPIFQPTRVTSEVSTPGEQTQLIKQPQKDQDNFVRLEQENKRLKDALDREMSSKDAVTLNEQEQKMLKQAREDLEAAKDTLNNLNVENDSLKKKVKEDNTRFEELDKKFSVFKTEFEHQKSIEWAKEDVLQNQIIKLQEGIRELQQLKELAARQRSQLETLENYKKKTEPMVGSLHEELSSAHKSIRIFQAQHKEALEKANKYREDLEVLRLSYEQKLSDATDRVLTMRGVKEVGEENVLSEEKRNLLERMRVQNDDLLKSNESLHQELSKLKEVSGFFKEKERILQYELTKSRAQSIGLERICEDLKAQIENLGKVS